MAAHTPGVSHTGTDRENGAVTNLGAQRDGATAGRPDQLLPVPRPRRGRLLATTALSLIAVDLVSKIIAVEWLTGRSVRLLGGLVYVTEARNTGAAFSFAEGLTVLFTAVAVAVVAVIIRTAPRLRSVPWAICLGLILGGAAGNLIDRLFRAPTPLRGAVVDWISLFEPDGQVWPIFNVADSGIVLGGILAVVLAAIGYEIDGARPGSPRPPLHAPPAAGPTGGPPRPARPAAPGPEASGPEASGREASGREAGGSGPLRLPPGLESSGPWPAPPAGAVRLPPLWPSPARPYIPPPRPGPPSRGGPPGQPAQTTPGPPSSGGPPGQRAPTTSGPASRGGPPGQLAPTTS
ncbi:MAG: signal peptidase, partial [Mycobacteriales bacterium]